MPRDEVEKDLIFLGFALYECPLKPDTAEQIDILSKGGNKVCIITGLS